MASFKLKLNGLPFGSQQFSYALDGDFFNKIEPTDVRSASIEVALIVTHEHEGLFMLEMNCRGTLVVPCDRCLDDMTLPIDVHYTLSVKQQGEELDDSHDGVLVVPEGWNSLDLAPLMRDTVLLAIPLMHTHDEGECDAAMMDVMAAHEALDFAPEARGSQEDSAAAVTDPRWDALRQLTDK